MILRPATCRLCGSAVTVDDTGKVMSHAPVASCASLAPTVAPLPDVGELRERKPCCRFFEVGHTMYKGVYLPSKEEYVAHGYMAENFDRAMADWKRGIDATGRP